MAQSEKFSIASRRYIGSKQSLTDWIFNNIPTKYRSGSFWDVFAGTASVGDSALHLGEYSKIILSDHLYSNEAIYQGFYGKGAFSVSKVRDFISEMNLVNPRNIPSNYFSTNFGNKYFDRKSALKIGYIREEIDSSSRGFNKREKSILLTSLIYSMDKVSNTVGHYEAFMRTNPHFKDFIYKEISPFKSAPVEIHRGDANELVRHVKCDVAYIDPPYNSRQYSRFYHVLETLVKWDKPTLEGVAMKPPTENSSIYCKVGAREAFEDLVQNLDAKFILVSYNNTYDSKSSSSKNRIQLDEIEEILSKKGKTKVLSKSYKPFNAGATSFDDHQEILFLCEVKK